MADRIGVMNKGKIEQIAAPQNLYQRPATEYVATFIGLTNRLPGASNGDEAVVFGQRVPLLAGSAKGDSVAVLVRPENLTLALAAAAIRTSRTRPRGGHSLPWLLGARGYGHHLRRIPALEQGRTAQGHRAAARQRAARPVWRWAMT